MGDGTKRTIVISVLFAIVFIAFGIPYLWTNLSDLTLLTDPWATPIPVEPLQIGAALSAEATAAALRSGDLARVNGQICVTNNGARLAKSLTIAYRIQYKVGLGEFQDIPFAADTLFPKDDLLPDNQRCYDYESEFEPVASAEYRTLATVTITNHTDWLPGGKNCPGPALCHFGPKVDAAFRLPAVLSAKPTNTRTPTPTFTITQRPRPTATATLIPTEPLPTDTPLPQPPGDQPPAPTSPPPADTLPPPTSTLPPPPTDTPLPIETVIVELTNTAPPSNNLPPITP